MAAQREGVLVLARHLVLLGHALGGLPHLESPVHLDHLRVDEPPSDGRVVHRLLAAGERAVRLGHHPRRAGHALHASGDHDIGAARLDLARSSDGRLHTRPTQAVHGLAWNLDRKARQQQCHASHIAVVLARLVGATEDHVGDIGRVHACSLTRFFQSDGGEVVRPHVLELPAITPHRGARRGDDDGVRHYFLARRARKDCTPSANSWLAAWDSCK